MIPTDILGRKDRDEPHDAHAPHQPTISGPTGGMGLARRPRSSDVSAYLIGLIEQTSERHWASTEYLPTFERLLEKYGGTMLAAALIEQVEGLPLDEKAAAVWEFPTAAAARGFWNDPDYQAVVPLRQPLGRFQIFILPGLDESPWSPPDRTRSRRGLARSGGPAASAVRRSQPSPPRADWRHRDRHTAEGCDCAVSCRRPIIHGSTDRGRRRRVGTSEAIQLISRPSASARRRPARSPCADANRPPHHPRGQAPYARLPFFEFLHDESRSPAIACRSCRAWRRSSSTSATSTDM